MECPRCENENRPAAKFCDGCGCRLPRLWPWPQVIIRPRADHGRARRKRRPSRQREIAAVVIVILMGAAIVTGIVIGSPRWRMIIASWRDSSAARSAMVSPLTMTLAERATWPTVSAGDAVRGEPAANPLVGSTSMAGIQPQSARPDRLESQEASALSARSTARLSAPQQGRSGPIPPNSAQALDPTHPTVGSPTSAQADNTQVMANFLVARLGRDPAWRTALVNADSHAPDSPEFVFWHRVAAAIRDGSTRPRQ